MYKKISQTLTTYFANKGIIDINRKPIYEYGFEILISTCIYALIFIVVSLLTKTFLESAFFLIGFFIIRTIAGGFHTNSYTACHILSLINHIAFILLLKLCSPQIFDLLSLIFCLVSIVCIVIFAPVDHPNKPFVKTEKKRFRKYSLVYALILTAFISVYWIFSLGWNNYVFSFSIGTLSAAFALTSAKINKIKEQKRL